MQVPHVQSPPPLVPASPQVTPAAPSPEPVKAAPPPPPPPQPKPVETAQPQSIAPAKFSGQTNASASSVNGALSFIVKGPSEHESFNPTGLNAYRSNHITPGLVRSASL